MNYELIKDNMVYFYEVSYDKEVLKEIMKELENYYYVKKDTNILKGDITRYASDVKKLERKVTEYFISCLYPGGILYTDTIKHVIDSDKDYVSYEYSFHKYPELYHFLDIIVNYQSINQYFMKNGYHELMKSIPVSSSISNIEVDSNQLVIGGLLNYIDSKELVDNEGICEDGVNEYDYNGLRNLYKECLECFTFKLISIKEYIQDDIQINGLSLQKKRL